MYILKNKQIWERVTGSVTAPLKDKHDIEVVGKYSTYGYIKYGPTERKTRVICIGTDFWVIRDWK